MNNQFEITGNILDKGELFENAQSGFKKRTFRLAIRDGERLSTPEFIVYNDNLGSLDSVREGDKVKVYFALSGREWKSKEGKILKFNDLTCWRIDLVKEEINVHKGKEKIPATPSDVRELTVFENNIPSDNKVQWSKIEDVDEDSLPF